MELITTMAKRPDITERLFSDPKVAEKLRLADSYILQQQRFGRDFVLPEEHEELQPIIDRYGKSLDRFVDFVKSVRDAVEPRKPSYIALHELYRMLEVRLVQQQRRERAKRALDWLAKKHPKLDAEQRLRWLRRLEQKWGKQRLQYMDVERRKTAKGRLSTDEREEILAEFWKEIDAQVDRGDLPSP